VKIRGFRIELGEIETQLARHPRVGEAAVIAREVGAAEKCLVAYFVPRQPDPAGGQATAEQLRAHLKAILPEYMVPSAFVQLEQLPLTANGKLDRRALPAPAATSYASRRYEAPIGEVEQVIARTWQELLDAEQLGRNDNFFDLGGHSLLAIKALFRVNQRLGCALKMTDLYRCPTPAELALHIGRGSTADSFVDLAREAALRDDELTVPPCDDFGPQRTVMLTGATGFVGRFLLAQLLQDTDATIYCLVRAPSQGQAQSCLRMMLLEWDLWCESFAERVIAVSGDLRLPRLGLDEATYHALASSIDCIYHCATSMNHLETYASAKAVNVDAARELLQLATRRRLKTVNYISTLSVFGQHGEDRVVDELSSIDQEQHLASSGYAASKWVGEKLFASAGARGIPCNIFRLGLAWADSRQGRYDELQREYRVLKSCLLAGFGIENYRYAMPPTPVDYVARAVTFLANRHARGGGVFHISSVRQTIDGVFERCNEIAGTTFELLPLYEWICEIKRLHRQGQALPVVPLLEFAFDMDRAAFETYQRSLLAPGSTRFDCSRTHRELELAAIIAPVLNDELLNRCVQAMLTRDSELREVRDVGSLSILGQRNGVAGRGAWRKVHR
jgi:thioester reductase-like protein